jgi:hypothetical protein
LPWSDPERDRLERDRLHSLSENGAAALGAQAGEARLADVFKKAGFSEFRKAKATPFNLMSLSGMVEIPRLQAK